MERVIFEPESHSYRNERTGEEYVSVTTFLGLEEGGFHQEEAVTKAIYSKSGKYKGWNRDEVLKEWERIRDEGTALHKHIEEHIKGKSLEDVPRKHRTAVYHFSQGKWGGEIMSETVVWSHTLKMAGTVDVICWKDAVPEKYTLYDIKTSTVINEWKLPKYSKQLYLYRRLFAETLEERFESSIKRGGIDACLRELSFERVLPVVVVGGIIHYEDYVNKRSTPPKFVRCEDYRGWSDAISRKDVESVLPQSALVA